MLDSDQSDAGNQALLAFAHAALGEFSEASRLLEQGRDTELDLDILTDRAGALLLLNRLDEAERILVSVIERNPAQALAHARLGYVLELRGEHLSAEAAYQTSWSLEPRRYLVGLNYIAVLRQNGKPFDAQAVLEALRHLPMPHNPVATDAVVDSHDPLNVIQLALWIESGRLKLAEDWVAQQSRQGGENSEWFGWTLQLAAFLTQQDRTAEGENVLRSALRSYPESVALMRRLSGLSKIKGNDGQAAHWLRRASKIDPDDVSLWVELCSVCLPNQVTLAREAADKASKLAAERWQAVENGTDSVVKTAAKVAMMQARLAQGELALETQQFDAADEIFRGLLQDAPHHLPTLRLFGQMQMRRGNIDDALQIFEHIKKLDPVSGHAALINARHFPQDIETVERLERAANRQSVNRKLRAGLMYQVAAAWEKHQRYQRAFDCAYEANEANKKYLRYDPKVHRDHCARIRERFSPDLFSHRSEVGSAATLPVFVVGMPRSGTTLVEQILAGHTRVHGAGELGTIPQLIAGLEQWERRVGSGRGYPDCVDDLNVEVAQGIANNVLKDLREYDANARYVVDKLPHNFENIGLIKLLFPNAKIISVRRDPRDIAVSNYFTDYQAKHGGMGFAYDLAWIGEQLADHNLLMQHWHAVFPGEILEIQYEDVVSDPEALARRMLDYLELPWEPQVLNTSELDRPVKTASVWQVRQPIYQTSKAKWKRYSEFLGPLIEAMKKKIAPDPITDMATLPVPGWLSTGIAHFKEGRLDDAELCFRKLLTHLPEHASANFMTGLVYVVKGHLDEGIALMEKAHKKLPANRKWISDLSRAYALAGREDDAKAMQEKLAKMTSRPNANEPDLTADVPAQAHDIPDPDEDDIPWREAGGHA